MAVGKLDALSDDDIDKINALVETLDKSSLGYLSIDLGDFRLTVGTESPTAEASQPARASAPAPALAPAAPAPSSEERPAASPSTLAESEFPGSIPVLASAMGRFYARPEPSAPPFVSVGQRVQPDTTVCLLELMKLFNGIVAGVSGVVAQVCVKDGDVVEFGQVLMRITPDEASGS